MNSKIIYIVFILALSMSFAGYAGYKAINSLKDKASSNQKTTNNQTIRYEVEQLSEPESGYYASSYLAVNWVRNAVTNTEIRNFNHTVNIKDDFYQKPAMQRNKWVVPVEVNTIIYPLRNKVVSTVFKVSVHKSNGRCEISWPEHWCDDMDDFSSYIVNQSKALRIRYGKR